MKPIMKPAVGWTIKWKRKPKFIGKNKDIPTDEYTYESSDGRFTINQMKWPSHSLYIISDAENDKLERVERKHDSLQSAKARAELIKDPNWDG